MSTSATATRGDSTTAAAPDASAASAPSGTARAKLQVVAAENFWGSIASQLGGDTVQVMSVITNPDTDPHA
ncbi:MAG TPA: ABC transporter substrate-binding protein, partial [Chloroflexota bacterium]